MFLLLNALPMLLCAIIAVEFDEVVINNITCIMFAAELGGALSRYGRARSRGASELYTSG